MHAPHHLATTAAKGLFWERSMCVCKFVSVCVCVWWWVLLSSGLAARQQPFFGSKVMGGLRLPLCFRLPCLIPPRSHFEKTRKTLCVGVCVSVCLHVKMRRIHWREILHGGE